MERPLRREVHGGCGERPGETSREQSRYRALGLLDRASLPLLRQSLNFAAGIIRRHRISIGSLWRKLNPGQQALPVLVCKGGAFASLAAGFGVGTATAWRYVEETVALLAARAPRLRKAARDAARAGHACRDDQLGEPGRAEEVDLELAARLGGRGLLGRVGVPGVADQQPDRAVLASDPGDRIGHGLAAGDVQPRGGDPRPSQI